MTTKIAVKCNECQKVWKVKPDGPIPQCSRCNSVDIDPLPDAS